jgi:L-alanine-DL-glutamate epimerase-like enolase superfamily enzyme
VTVERFELEPDSTIRVPTRPGLGVAINPTALAKVTLARETFA